MTDKMKESRKIAVHVTGFAPFTTPEEIYDYAELRYGPAFAQECLDSLTQDLEPSPRDFPNNRHISDFMRLTNQLHALSQVCKADFFQDWGAEEQLFYMNLLTSVSNDLSVALHGSLNQISTNEETGNGR